MAINKNFVVRNGLEVAETLLYVDDVANKVGINSAIPRSELDVYGNIKVSTLSTPSGVIGGDIYAVGIVTAALFSGAGLIVSGVTSVSDFYVSGISTFNGTTNLNTTNISGNLTFTTDNDIYLKDNGTIYFGDSNDLQIFHDGSTSIIRDGGTGGLLIDSDNEVKIAKNGTGNDTLAVFIPDGSVELYYDNSKKFETLGAGVTVTGTTFTNQLNVSGVSTSAYLNVPGSAILNSNSAELYYNGDKKFETTSSGTKVVGGQEITGGNLGVGVNGIRFTPTPWDQADIYHPESGLLSIENYVSAGGEIRLSVNAPSAGSVSEIVRVKYNAVGIGTTLPSNTLDVAGGIDANSVNLSGIATANSYYVDNTEVISNSRELKNIVSLDSVTTATIENAIAVAPNNFNDLNVTGISTLGTVSDLNVIGISTLGTLIDLNVTGISTLGTVQISSGIVTASSGIVTYYGDGQYLQNILSGVGVATAGGTVGTGATILDFRGAGISTVTVSAGIATINIEGGGGGGGGAVSIGTEAPPTPSNGDLWYSPDYGRTFVWYDEVALGIGSTAVWVDAAPFNVNLTQLGDLQVNSLVVANHTDLNTLSVSGISTLGNVVSSGIITAVDFNSTSDETLKYNVETVDHALDTVNSLRGVKFQWKEDDRVSYGVIAQELQQVLPELVSAGDIKTVNYNGIIGVLIEAVKELKAEIEELKKSS